MTRVFVGRTTDIPEGKMIHMQIDNKKKDILIANIRGHYYATSNICTHEGAELHEGELKNNYELVCPWHGARWDVTTGRMIMFPEKLKSLRKFKVIVENDNLYVEG